jgi:hypothetical protein
MRRQRDIGCARLVLNWLVVVLVTSMLSGCGAVKLAYDHGETFAMFWIGRYLDLDSQQEILVHERLQAFIAWHRRNELPDYVQLARSLQDEAAAGISGAEQAALEAALRERGYRALNRAMPDLADIALSLRVDQLTKMREKFADNDQEYRNDFIDVSSIRRNRDRADKWRERIEYWYGDLNRQQRATLDALSDAQPIDPVVALAERQSREADSLAVLTRIAQTKPSRGEAMQQLAALARRLESSPDPKRRAYLEAVHASNSAIFVQMANLMTPEQRQFAVKRLGDWISDMQAAAVQ